MLNTRLGKEMLIFALGFIAVATAVAIVIVENSSRSYELYRKACAPDIYVGKQEDFFVRHITCMPQAGGPVRIIDLSP